MTNGETNTRDKRVVDAYRTASAALDERPQASTRAAILAAAARAVDAQPQDAQTGATSARGDAARAAKRAGGIAPSRRPLALVASFLVATVAIVIATQTERHDQHEQQAATAPSAPAPAEAKPEVAPQAAKETTQTAQVELESKREAFGPTTTVAASGAAMKDKADAAPPTTRPNQRAQPQPPTGQRAPANPALRELPATPGTQPAPAVPPVPAAPQAPAKPKQPSSSNDNAAPAQYAADPPAQLAKAAEPQRRERALTDAIQSADGRSAQAEASRDIAASQAPAAAGVLSAPVAEERSPMAMNRQSPGARADQTLEGDRTVPEKMVKARPVQRTAAMNEPNVENDPARWMERIIALRDAGRDDDADRELGRLRERYPEQQVPPNALRRTGTR